MPVREIKTTIALDGEQQFKKALADATREMRVMDSELKAVTEAYRTNGDGAEYFAAKQRTLRAQISQQEQIIKSLEQAVKDAARAYGDSSSEVDGYAIKLNNARARMSQLERQLTETDREVEELGRDSIKAGRQLEQGIGDGAEEAEDDVKSLIRTMQEDLASVRASTTFSAVRDLWDLASGSYASVAGFVSSTAEYRKQLSFLEQNAATYNIDFDYIKGQLVEVQTLTGESSSAVEGLSNLMQTGMDEARITKAVDLLAGAVISFPDTVEFESLADSLQETLATGEATGQFAELLGRLGVNVSEFNDAMEKSPTAAGDLDIALGYLADNGLKKVHDQWKANNQKMIDNQRLMAKLDQEQAALGEKLEQYIITPFNGLKLAATQKVLEVIEYIESELDKYAEEKGYTNDKTGRSEPGIGGYNQSYTKPDLLVQELEDSFKKKHVGEDLNDVTITLKEDEESPKTIVNPDAEWMQFVMETVNSIKNAKTYNTLIDKDGDLRWSVGVSNYQQIMEAYQEAGEDAGEAFLNGMDMQIELDAENAENAGIANVRWPVGDVDYEKMVKEAEKKLREAEPDLQDAGEEAGEAINKGFEAALANLERIARAAGATAARGFAEGIYSQAGAAAVAAGSLASGISSAGTKRFSSLPIVMTVDGRAFAQGMMPYTNESMAVDMQFE